jgi:hypothetical protein
MILENLLQHLNSRIALVTTLIVILAVLYVRSPWRKVPPGPKGLPVIGNALQLRDKGWMFEKDTKQKFGEYSTIFAHSLYRC